MNGYIDIDSYLIWNYLGRKSFLFPGDRIKIKTNNYNFYVHIDYINDDIIYSRICEDICIYINDFMFTTYDKICFDRNKVWLKKK